MNLQQAVADPRYYREHVLIDVDGVPTPLGKVMAAWQRRDFEAADPAWMRICGRLTEPWQPQWLHHHYRERGRGGSKTTDIGTGTALWALLASIRQLSLIAAAADLDQARLLRDSIARTCRLNEEFGPLIDVQANRVRNVHTGSELTILSSHADSAYGQTPDGLLVDELSHWSENNGRELWDSLISSAAKRRECVVVVISNAPRGMGSSWQWNVRESCRTSPAWDFSRLDGPPEWITEENIEELRRLLPRKAFDRLVMNNPQTDAGDLLPSEEIDAAFTLEHAPEGPFDRSWFYVGSLDLSRVQDNTVLIVNGGKKGSGRVQLMHVQGWTPTAGSRIDQEQVKAACLAARKKFPGLWLRIEAWEADRLAAELDPKIARFNSEKQSGNARGEWVELVPPTESNKYAQTRALIDAFSSRSVDLFPDERLSRDLRRLCLVETEKGIKVQLPRDRWGHCDFAAAYMLSLQKSVPESNARKRNFFITTGSEFCSTDCEPEPTQPVVFNGGSLRDFVSKHRI